LGHDGVQREGEAPVAAGDSIDQLADAFRVVARKIGHGVVPGGGRRIGVGGGRVVGRRPVPRSGGPPPRAPGCRTRSARALVESAVVSVSASRYSPVATWPKTVTTCTSPLSKFTRMLSPRT